MKDVTNNLINSLERQTKDAYKAFEMGIRTMDPINLDYASFLYQGLKKRIEGTNGTDDILNLERGGDLDTYTLQTVVGRTAGLLKLKVEREGDIYCSERCFTHTEDTWQLAQRIPKDPSIPFWDVQSVALSLIMQDNKYFDVGDLMWNVRRHSTPPEGYAGFHVTRSEVTR